MYGKDAPVEGLCREPGQGAGQGAESRRRADRLVAIGEIALERAGAAKAATGGEGATAFGSKRDETGLPKGRILLGTRPGLRIDASQGAGQPS